MSDSEHAPRLWAVEFSNGWDYTPHELAAHDAKILGLPVVEYVRAADLQGAVDLIRRLAALDLPGNPPDVLLALAIDAEEFVASIDALRGQ